jgi:hypothetical protein
MNFSPQWGLVGLQIIASLHPTLSSAQVREYTISNYTDNSSVRIDSRSFTGIIQIAPGETKTLGFSGCDVKISFLINALESRSFTQNVCESPSILMKK